MAALALLIGCVRSPPVSPPLVPAEAAKAEVWVDAMALPGGDGSREHPARELGPVLVPRARIHLKSGLYPGPFVLPAEVELLGEGQAVLFREGAEGEVVAAPEGASLTRVSVQGGRVGLVGSGSVLLEQVHFSGHRAAALQMSAGELTAKSVEVEATVADSAGFVLDATPGAVPPAEPGNVPGPPPSLASAPRALTVRLRGADFRGAFKHALDVRGASLELSDSELDGAGDPVRVRDSIAVLRDVAVKAGRGPAVMVAGSKLTVTGLVVVGHEYGLQARASELHVDGLKVRLSEHAGAGLVLCTGTLSHLLFERPGNFAAMQLLSSKLTVREMEIRDADAAGLMVRQGEVSLDGLKVRGVRAESSANGQETGGDALMLRDCKGSVKNVDIEDAEGAGGWISAGAVVTVENLSCRRCGVGALVVELAARVSGGPVVADDVHGPAVSVLEHGQLELKGLESHGAEVPVWAECERGAVAKVTGVVGQDQPSSPCIVVRQK